MHKPQSYQPISVEKVKRSQVKEHPKNPRVMNDEARRALEAGLSRFGMLEPIPVNRRTGHCLGAHQRLAWMDRKHKGKDYELLVAWCDLEPAREADVLALLNNDSAQGEWNLPLLKEMLAAGEIDAQVAGFSNIQLETLFPDDYAISHLFTEAPKPVTDSLEKLGQIAKARKGKGKGLDPDLDSETFVVLVFKDRREKEWFLSVRGLDTQERYVEWSRISDEPQIKFSARNCTFADLEKKHAAQKKAAAKTSAKKSSAKTKRTR